MNILVVDAQGLLTEKQADYARKRFHNAMAKFGQRISGATLHFLSDDRSQRVTCLAHVSIEGNGVVSVKRRAATSYKAMSAAVDAAELKVGLRVDWKTCFDPESLASTFEAIKQPFYWLMKDGRKTV